MRNFFIVQATLLRKALSSIVSYWSITSDRWIQNQNTENFKDKELTKNKRNTFRLYGIYVAFVTKRPHGRIVLYQLNVFTLIK